MTREIVVRPDWDYPVPQHVNQPPLPPVTSGTTSSASERRATDAEHARPTTEDRALSTEVQVDDDDVDADEIAANRKLLADGIFTKEALARFRGRSVEEIDAQLKPKSSRQAVDQELAAIRKTMREDRRTYDKDTKMQARYLELLELRETLKAGPAPAKSESEPDEQGDGPGLDPALVEEWERAGGVEHHLQTAQRTASAALDALEDEDRSSLETGFDDLPPSAQTQITRFLAVEGGAFPAANETAVRQFAESEEAAAELVKDFGREAGRKLGVAWGRVGVMLAAMEPKDRERAELWFGSLPGKQAAAVLKALAG